MILILSVLCISCDGEDKEGAPVETFNMEYAITSKTANSLTLSFNMVDTDFTSYAVSSFVPNISCCQGTFLLENNVVGTINGTTVSNTPITGDNSFDLSIDNFNDGMNYTTIQISNDFGLYFYSIQFYFDSVANEVDYMNVIRATKSAPDYFSAAFKYDYYTNSNINILIELENGIREQPLSRLANGTGEFKFISSGGGTGIVKTTREKI